MIKQKTDVSFEPYFGGFILETLTIGMYGEARNAIREYIQNGYDSIQRAIRDLKILPADAGVIEIELGENRDCLTIRDNGAGLRARNAVHTLTRVGASSKSHLKNAGFRGIGRLAGIVFCDSVTFVTKAKGESEQTTVVIDSKAMRAAMAPGKGSTTSALDLMRNSIAAFRTRTENVDSHFFEVKLEGLRDAPDECVSAQEMASFVSQVAPLPYPEDFPFREVLADASAKAGIPIDEVKVTIQDGSREPRAVTKRYHKRYQFESGYITLSECTIYNSERGDWWAWVGKKTESGAYIDSKVSGLRVRVRNIQIDGTDVVRDIFRSHAPSYVRFQDYFLGEIFVKPSALVPNARRDGFEENPDWKRIQKELAKVVHALGREAYSVSLRGLHSVDALRRNLKKARKDLLSLEKIDFSDTDATIALSKRVTTYQSRVSKATLGAGMEVATELQALGSAFADIKQKALSRVGNAAAEIDRERVQQEAREELLQEIIGLLEDTLSPGCFDEAREILVEEYLQD